MVLLGVGQLLSLPHDWIQHLSPAAADLRHTLMPSTVEMLGDGTPATMPTTSLETLSLYPGSTREAVVRLLAIFALFCLVRNNLATPEGLRRFAVVAAANGALLSLFALAQHFTAAPHVVYWNWETQGQVFGPYICRNHFPFYVNACLGLGLGLLFSLRPGRVRQGGTWAGSAE